jgi:hypothetical protein
VSTCDEESELVRNRVDRIVGYAEKTNAVTVSTQAGYFERSTAATGKISANFTERWCCVTRAMDIYGH